MTDRHAVFTRWVGLFQLGWRRVTYRLSRAEHRRTLVMVAAVGVPLAILLLIGSVGMGLAVGAADGGSADYWIVPQHTDSPVMSVQGPKLAAAHETSARIMDRDDVAFATPMVIEMLVAETESGPTYLLAIGVVPSEEYHDLAPLSTADLATDTNSMSVDDDAAWNGDVILSDSAASAIGVSPGESFELRGHHSSLHVVAIEEPESIGLAQLPIAVMSSHDLQLLTRGADDDVAAQIVVVAPFATAETEDALAALYPRTTLETTGGVLSQRIVDARLPAATALAGMLITIVIGSLFVSTSFGFELLAERLDRATMWAIGLSSRSRTVVLVIELGVISLYGAMLGVVLWLGAAMMTNILTEARYGVAIAQIDPRLLVLAIGVTFSIWVCSIPYLLLVDRQAMTGWRAE